MESIDEQLVEAIDGYIERLFVPPDPVLQANLHDADAAGMPAIAVSPNQGKFLYLLAKMARVRRVLEVGTLGGYSTTCLARALPADGKVVTLELEQKHADVARRNINRAQLAAEVEIRVGSAAASLEKMIAAGELPFDMIFIDADKNSYPEYLRLVMQLSHPGTVIMGDNLIRHGLVMDESSTDSYAVGARTFNRLIAEDPRLESIILTVVKGKVDGMSISVVK